MAAVASSSTTPTGPTSMGGGVLPVMHFRSGAVRSVCCVDESQIGGQGEQLSSHHQPKIHSHFVQLAIKIVDAPPVVMATPPSVVTVTSNNNKNGGERESASKNSSKRRRRSSSRRRKRSSSSSPSTSRRHTVSPTSSLPDLDVSDNTNREGRFFQQQQQRSFEEGSSSSPSSPQQQKDGKRRSSPPTFAGPRTFSVRNLRRSMSFRTSGGASSSSPSAGSKQFHALVSSDDEGVDYEGGGGWEFPSFHLQQQPQRGHRAMTTNTAPQPNRRRSSSVDRQVELRYARGSNNFFVAGGNNDPTFMLSHSREAAY
mmetsp:Transcript_3122/g.4289  ORF Transcript_3122/g.4289 Transcript_3122/m.4289 type:complete len:313 (-) Transcript_3122:229-1167(-)|eukprot:CAMPEP_0194053816 /NCGR_PEP_ID=MMETSP0009_2-20130614/51353_1 /TAXON_ID=210454 /ORGANISM="Grammatophora oceanica, Strain CCMP 410" /LENGTH=312 /DNA_ID=CAMNT_0038702081 /DNA_START=52 /DNA_END=990 /DNA_ORIENTATION=-